MTKFKRAGENKKINPSPRNGSIAIESSLKHGHVKNKKSFDLSSLYQAKNKLLGGIFLLVNTY